MPPLIDIGANLLDPQFRGEYRGKAKHAPDLDAVLERGWSSGLRAAIVTAGSLAEGHEALRLASRDGRLFSTVGVHPTRCDEFEEDPEGHTARLLELLRQGAETGKVVAVGECGLDYARTEFCAKEVQLRHFERHFELAERCGLPLFLHVRDAAADMLACLRRNRHRFEHAVVHSFDGTEAEAAAFLELGLHIGINGCSLKTAENLKVVEALPLDRIMLETDCPWCDVRRTHAGFAHVRSTWPTAKKPEKWERGGCVKARTEPCHLHQVLEVVAGVKQISTDELAAAVLANTLRVFKVGGNDGPPLQSPAAPPPFTPRHETPATLQSCAVPLGHTTFSWGCVGEESRPCPPPLGHTNFSWRAAAVAAARTGLRRAVA